MKTIRKVSFELYLIAFNGQSTRQLLSYPLRTTGGSVSFPRTYVARKNQESNPSLFLDLCGVSELEFFHKKKM